MAKFLIEGGNKLSGTVQISGNKNSILPCIAATLLTQDKVVLHNTPRISDVFVFIDILHSLGVEADIEDHTLTIQARQINTTDLSKELTNKLRASILLVGPLLAKVGSVTFSHPGGDIIGKRSIDTHLSGFKTLGYHFEVSDRDYKGNRNGGVTANEIFLDEASVTATENLLLGSVIGNQVITFRNCAKEPHVVDLCNLLNRMGAKIEGIGESTLTVTQVESLHGAEFNVGFDFLELGTYAIAAAITGGEVKAQNCSLKDMEPVLNPLREMGIIFEEQGDGILLKASQIKPIPKLVTNIWPGFPSDLMSVVIVLATQASGVSLLHDWMYESRMFFADKLISMGAQITIADPHRVLVYGPTKLMARDLESPDIRAGMAMVLASLMAHGKSTIHKAELIERGYEDVVGKLRSLGANIERID
jgi:UDP-N-acetylglucosamine 1-carboxyvinyltransferase